MDAVQIFTLLLLLGAANGAPLAATKLLRQRFSQPVDGGLCFVDGRPLFGPSKTWRGIVSACAATAMVAWVLGFDWQLGLGIALLSMVGDLASSFIKRRIGMGSSGMALGLDQIPEALLPLLVYAHRLELSTGEIVVTVAIFFVAELILSRILYALHWRDRPY